MIIDTIKIVVIKIILLSKLLTSVKNQDIKRGEIFLYYFFKKF